jgi:hypothetical protein
MKLWLTACKTGWIFKISALAYGHLTSQVTTEKTDTTLIPKICPFFFCENILHVLKFYEDIYLGVNFFSLVIVCVIFDGSFQSGNLYLSFLINTFYTISLIISSFPFCLFFFWYSS